jgi:hypothetical protein
MQSEELSTPCYAKLLQSVLDRIDSDFPYYHVIGKHTLIINHSNPSVNNIYKATIKGKADSPTYEVRREDIEVIS